MSLTENRLQDLLATAVPARAPRLPRVRGVAWKERGRGELVVGAARAELWIEPGARLRATLALGELSPARDALGEPASWPGNARLALRPDGFVLLADGWLDDEPTAARSLREIRLACARALGARRSTPPAEPPLALADLATALGEHGERFVELDGGFELYPRIAGHPVPVRALAETRGLCISRALAGLTLAGRGDPARRPLEHLALRLNARLRFARLVERDGRVHAESRLSPGLAQLRRVLACARAVALAAEHAEAHLAVLARDPRMARAYARVFLPATPHEGDCR